MKRTLSELETIRAQDLLASRSTQGLDDAEQAELDSLGAAELEGFELTAAAIDLATVPDRALPAGLADKIIASALATAPFARGGAAQPSFTAPAVPAVAAVLPARDPVVSIRGRAPAGAGAPRVSRGAFGRPAVAWATTAAALAVAAAAWGWAGVRSPGAPAAVAAGAPVRARQMLLDAADPTRVVQSGRGAARGDVVWSTAQQRGYLRVIGLAPNAPATQQYQLWIFDRARDPRYPVDGGVFDVRAPAEVVVPIVPRLPITAPVRFLVTAERPGGTVVSERATVVFSTE